MTKTYGHVTLLIAVAWLVCGESPAYAELPQAQALRERFKIECEPLSAPVQTKIDNTVLFANRCAESDATVFLEIFLEALAIYPADVLPALRIQHIYLTTDLKCDGSPAAAVTDLGRRITYIEVNEITKGEIRAHALLHGLLFYCLRSSHPDVSAIDALWLEVNPPGFAYAKADADEKTLYNAPPGFWGHASTSSIAADQAGVFAGMITTPRLIARHAEDDAVLGTKLKYIRQLVKEANNGLNEEFWNAVDRRPSSWQEEFSLAQRNVFVAVSSEAGLVCRADGTFALSDRGFRQLESQISLYDLDRLAKRSVANGSTPLHGTVERVNDGRLFLLTIRCLVQDELINPELMKELAIVRKTSPPVELTWVSDGTDIFLQLGTGKRD